MRRSTTQKAPVRESAYENQKGNPLPVSVRFRISHTFTTYSQATKNNTRSLEPSFDRPKIAGPQWK